MSRCHSLQSSTARKASWVKKNVQDSLSLQKCFSVATGLRWAQVPPNLLKYVLVSGDNWVSENEETTKTITTKFFWEVQCPLHIFQHTRLSVVICKQVNVGITPPILGISFNIYSSFWYNNIRYTTSFAAGLSSHTKSTTVRLFHDLLTCSPPWKLHISWSSYTAASSFTFFFFSHMERHLRFFLLLLS